MKNMVDRIFYSMDGCWYWLGAKNKHGYGTLRLKKKYLYAHRLAFQCRYPTIKIEGLQICHTCDNRLCVNPDHLFAGTLDNNMADMVKKNRSAHGERQGRSKLTERDIVEIMNNKGKLSQSTIGKMFGVSQSCIYFIHKGESWKRVTSKISELKVHQPI